MKKLKTFLYIFIFIPVLLTTLSCKDDIFYQISQEIELIDPRIKGSPTNFVMFEDRMYVATGKAIWAYYASTGVWEVKKEGKWSKKTVKGNDYSIVQLAVTSSRIYALCIKDNNKSTARKIIYNDTTSDINDGRWKTVITKDYDIIHSIYTAEDKLYIGSQNSGTTDYAVHVLNADGTFDKTVTFPDKNEKKENNSHEAILTGVAADNSGTVFLCTVNGIFDTDGNAIKDGEDSNFIFMSIIKLDDTIVAITRGGTLYKIETTGLTKIRTFTENQTSSALKEGRWATSAICICLENIDEPSVSRKLLLVGRRDTGTSINTGYTYGYFELGLELDEYDNLVFGNRFNEPGSPDDGKYSSIGPAGKKKYPSSLGVLPIKSIFQAPNGIIFASTQQNGVWSYKFRRDEGGKKDIWNSEE